MAPSFAKFLLFAGAATAATLKSRQDSCPTDPSVISDCTYFACSQSGDTCASIAADWGITVAQFEHYNPSVGSDCSNFKIEENYCVEENYGKGPVPSTTSTTSTITKTSTTSPTSTAPSPTQAGLVSDCQRYYLVQSGDTCSYIVDKYQTFTLQDFYNWNPAVKTDCSQLQAGYYVCVGVPGTPTSAPAPKSTTTSSGGPSPTQSGIASDCNRYYDVQSGDTCQGIVDKYGTFTLDQFYKWNPAVQSDCSKLFVGYYVCIGVPGTPTTATTKTSTKSSITSTATGPTPTQSGIASDCQRYYKAVSGDTCQGIVDKYGEFSLAQFEKWNPAVESDCSKLFVGYYYCVGVPGTPTTRTSSSVKPTSTAKGPQPQQTGIVSNCNKYYDVAKGDSCYSIEQTYGITSTQFFKWNTGIKSDCSNLLAGYYCCVGVS